MKKSARVNSIARDTLDETIELLYKDHKLANKFNINNIYAEILRKIVTIFLPINLNICFKGLKRTVSLRWLFGILTTYVVIEKHENNFQLRALICVLG